MPEMFRILINILKQCTNCTSMRRNKNCFVCQSRICRFLHPEFSGAFQALAWRCLDAQFWGVAQRRKRIFLVADFAGPLAPLLLFDVLDGRLDYAALRQRRPDDAVLSGGG